MVKFSCEELCLTCLSYVQIVKVIKIFVAETINIFILKFYHITLIKRVPKSKLKISIEHINVELRFLPKKNIHSE